MKKLCKGKDREYSVTAVHQGSGVYMAELKLDQEGEFDITISMTNAKMGSDFCYSDSIVMSDMVVLVDQEPV